MSKVIKTMLAAQKAWASKSKDTGIWQQAFEVSGVPKEGHYARYYAVQQLKQMALDVSPEDITSDTYQLLLDSVRSASRGGVEWRVIFKLVNSWGHTVFEGCSSCYSDALDFVRIKIRKEAGTLKKVPAKEEVLTLAPTQVAEPVAQPPKPKRKYVRKEKTTK
jgi:hypothetical protein